MKKNIIFDKNFLNENGVNVNTINSQTITVETVNQTGDLSIDGNLTISNNLDINGTTLNTSSNELNINKTINTTGGIVCNQITNNSGTSSNTLLGQYNFFDQVNLNGSSYGVTQNYTNNTNVLATCAFVKNQFVNDISFNSNISVADNIYFNGNLYQNGNIFSGSGGSSNNFTGNVTITAGDLTVSGNIILNNVGGSSQQDYITISPSTNATPSITLSQTNIPSNGIRCGIADGATSTTCNVQINSNYGVGFYNSSSNPGVYNIWFDVRLGTINATTFNSTSDRRIKKDIENINLIESIQDLKPL